MRAVGFGRMQLRIMQVLWEHGATSAREITEALNKSEPVAHSTVQTLLRQLEAKGAVGHRVQGRTFVFHARLEQAKVQRRAARDLLERVFGGSAGDLAAYLIKNESLSHAELAELRKLIDQARER